MTLRRRGVIYLRGRRGRVDMAQPCLEESPEDSLRLAHHPIQRPRGFGIFVPIMGQRISNQHRNITYLFVQEFEISCTLILSISLVFWLVLIIPSSIISCPLIVLIIIVGITIYWVIVLEGFLAVFELLARDHMITVLKLTLGGCWESLEQSNNTLRYISYKNIVSNPPIHTWSNLGHPC